MKKVISILEKTIKSEEQLIRLLGTDEYLQELKKAHSILSYMNTPIADWTEADFFSSSVDDSIKVPDNLVPLWNNLLTQLRFHTISGKGEVETIVSMVWIAQKFFKEFPKETEK